jgi:hypothetical protein
MTFDHILLGRIFGPKRQVFLKQAMKAYAGEEAKFHLFIIRKYVLNIWSEHNYIFSHRIVHTSTCFGPVYWPSSYCIVNVLSSYTICACGLLYCIAAY